MTDSKINPSDIIPEGVINANKTNETINNTLGSFSDFAKHGFDMPAIHPVFANLWGFEIRWYSLAYLFGILLGWFYISYLNKKHGNNYLSRKTLDDLPLWMVLSVVLGGRIGYVLFYNFTYYKDNISDMYKVWQGGMSFHGGLIGVILGAFIFSKVKKIEFFRLTDFLAAATPIGLFLGRLANFINRELIGKPISNIFVSWGVYYPGEVLPRHPSQIYEALMEGLLLFIILLVAIKFFKAFERKGLLSGLFLSGYGTFRFIAEFFREPDRQIGYVISHVSMGQLLCIPMILAGVVILVLSKRVEESKN